MQGRLAETQGDYDKAAERYLASVAFASASSRGGLVMHDYDVSSHAEVGFRLLYQCIDKLPMLKNSLDTLSDYDLGMQYEPMENYVYRSNVYVQRSRGWYGHLMDMFGPSFCPEFFEWYSYIGSRTVDSTISRLLQAELALRAYKADHEASSPNSLADLVPEYLSEVPIDPCSLDSSTLRYKREGDRFIVYSVGHNRVDDHGEESSQSISYAMHGDIWLEDWFAPAEE